MEGVEGVEGWREGGISSISSFSSSQTPLYSHRRNFEFVIRSIIGSGKIFV